MRLDQLIAIEGKGISLQISGGEPSVRKDLDQIAALVKSKGFGQLEMVSNGIRLAREHDFAEKLVKWGFTSVYLQFDSTRPEDIIHFRGEDLWDVRVKAIAALERVKLPSTLAVSLQDGINSDQIQQVIYFAWQHPDTVCAIAFQAATPFGRFDVAKNADDSDEDAGEKMPALHANCVCRRFSNLSSSRRASQKTFSSRSGKVRPSATLLPCSNIPKMATNLSRLISH